VLGSDRFEVVSNGSVKTVKYKDVAAMRQRGDRVSVVLKQGSVTIKPHAHIVAGRIRVPVGWTRNGIEVPFDTLPDELSARCGVNIEHL
jgi:hypothetical protein